MSSDWKLLNKEKLFDLPSISEELYMNQLTQLEQECDDDTKTSEEYDEIITISIDPNHQILASVITKDGASETIFIHPITAKKLGKPNERLAIFEFATTLHRSLFLKSVGRFFVGFISLLLSFIVISGIAL